MLPNKTWSFAAKSDFGPKSNRMHPQTVQEDEMNETTNQLTTESQAEKLVYFPRADGSRVPFKVYSSPQIYQLEQERIFRGPIWSFVAMEAEIPRTGDFKSTFVGDTPVVVTRHRGQSSRRMGEPLRSSWRARLS